MRNALRSAGLGAVFLAAIVLTGSTAHAVNVCTAADIIANSEAGCPVSTTLDCTINKTTYDVVLPNCTFDFGTRNVILNGTIDINSNSVTFISKNFTVGAGGIIDGRGISGGAVLGGNVTIQASGNVDIQKATQTGRIQVLGNTAAGKIIITTTGGSITVSGTLDASGNGGGARAGAIALTATAGITINSGSTVEVSGATSTFVPALPKLALTASSGGVTIAQNLGLDGGGNAGGLTVSASGAVTIGSTTTIDVGANSATIASGGNVTLTSTAGSAAYIDGRGSNAAPADLGAVVTITAGGSIDVQRVVSGAAAAIDAGGNSAGGRISLTAGTSVNIGGRLNIAGLGSESDAGIITVDAGTTITTGSSSDINGSAPFGHAGGDVTFTAVGNLTLGTPTVNLDGGDGGSLSLSSLTGAVAMQGMTAKGNGTGFVQDLGSGGFLDVAAGLGITVNGAISANGTHDGCGGCVQAFADFGNLVINGSIDTNSTSPYEGGAGGQIALSAPGTITVANGASLTAFGDGQYGCGGTIDLDGVLGVTINGALDAKGGSGGGFICVFSDADIAINNSVTVSGIAAAGVGGDLTVQAGISGPGNLTLANAIEAKGGGCTMLEGCGTGGSASLEGCNINLTLAGSVDVTAPSGTGDVTFTAHENLTVAGNVDARFTTDPFGSDGTVTFEYRTGTTQTVTGTVQPAALLDPRSTCTALSVPANCLTSCPTCGNGTVTYPETCDPIVQMPPLNCDGCNRFCRTEASIDDNNVCTTDTCDSTLGEHHTLNPPCPTETPTLTPTGGTLTPTFTRTQTRTRTQTPTRTPTVTPTITGGTVTPSFTPTVTRTSSPTLTPTVSQTPTITLTPLPTLQVSNGVGRPGGRICLAAKLNNAGTPQTFSNDIADFSGIPVSFQSVAINPTIGPSTTPNKSVDRSTNSGTDTYNVGPMNGVGIPNGELYTASYLGDAMATPGTYPLSQPPGLSIIISNCTGDCDGSGGVTMAEVQICINKFLGNPICNPSSSTANCPIADIDGNGSVSIGEMQQCVLKFLGGCGM